MKIESKILYASILISIILSWIIFFFCSVEELNNLTKEDHFFEWLGTSFLLASSIGFFITFLRDKNGNDLFLFKTRKNYFFLLLTLLFFFGFGEELSWGQRIFNVQTPLLLNKINDQQETNIHNLEIFRGILNFNHLFTFFWTSYCLIIPILYRKSTNIKVFLNRINLPIVPIWLGMFFLFSYSISLVFKFSLSNLDHAVTEVKETSLCSLFFIFSIICLNKNHRQP